MKHIRGYLRGLAAAANYVGISDRDTFREWARVNNLRPRIISGQAFFKITTLDRFMDPDNNPPGAEEAFWRAAPKTSG